MVRNSAQSSAFQFKELDWRIDSEAGVLIRCPPELAGKLSSWENLYRPHSSALEQILFTERVLIV
jgi:hypothetical protein